MTSDVENPRPPTERVGVSVAAPTTFERVGGRVPTQLEEPSASPMRVREGPDGSPDIDGSPASGEWIPMPGSLQRRFVYQKTLRGGGEANLFLATDNESNGLLVVVKLYNQGIELNEEAMTRLKAIADRDTENANVVRLITWGVAPDAQQSYEVQEYLDAGDLYQFLSRNGRLRDGRRRIDPASELAVLVVEELYLAMKAMHDAGLSHHDIKPSNVLVRAVSPRLDLVLADFGLAVAADRTVFLSRRIGTIAYDSPESLGAGQGGPKRDFWALGMTIAELVSGRHPFATVDNPDVFLSDAAIRDHLYSWRPIDLSAVDDDRFRLLCEGLTRYNQDHRWGAHEIEAWLAGHSPEVLPDGHRSEGVGLLPNGITFAGRVIGSRAELAEAMAGDWRGAAGQLSSAQSRQTFLDQIASTLGSAGIEELEANWAVESPGIDRSIADLICTLDPTRAQAVFRGFLVGANDLAPLARSVASHDQKAAAVIEPLFNQHGLIPLSLLPGHSQLKDINHQWHQSVGRYDAALTIAEADGVSVEYPRPVVLATLLAAIADPEFAQDLANERDTAMSGATTALTLPWFKELCSEPPDDLAAMFASRVLAKPAEMKAKEVEAADVARLHKQRAAAEQTRLQTLASVRVPVSNWLAVTTVVNTVVAISLAIVRYRVHLVTGSLSEEAADLHFCVSLWPLWMAAGIASLVMAIILGKSATKGQITVGQCIGVFSAFVVPFMVPIGLIYACHSRRVRLRSISSSARGWASSGIALASGVLVLAVANPSGSLFDFFERKWPIGVQTWYFRSWPKAVLPSEVLRHLEMVIPIGIALIVAGLLGIWLSYGTPIRGPIKFLFACAIVAGLLGVAFLLPIIGTIVAYLGILALLLTIMAFIFKIVCEMMDYA